MNFELEGHGSVGPERLRTLAELWCGASRANALTSNI